VDVIETPKIGLEAVDGHRVLPILTLGATDLVRVSGRIVARSAVGEGFPFPLFRLRGGVIVSPWRTFSTIPLRFRKAGFPRYGSKAGLSDRAFPDHASVNLAPSMPVAVLRFASILRAPRGSMDTPF